MIYEKDADFFTCFSSEIESLLALLKLVSPKPKGRSGRKNNNNDFFQKIVDDFITFLPVTLSFLSNSILGAIDVIYQLFYVPI